MLFLGKRGPRLGGMKGGDWEDFEDYNIGSFTDNINGTGNIIYGWDTNSLSRGLGRGRVLQKNPNLLSKP